jgi:hypothetical protein
LFGFRCLPRRTRPLFQRGGCPEEPALYFNEGVASGSRRVLFDRLAFSASSNVLLAFAFVRPLSSSHFVSSLLVSFCLVALSRHFVLSFCLVALSRRFVSSFCLVASVSRCLDSVLPSSGRRFVPSRFVSSFCLVASVSRCLDSVLPSSGRRFAPTGPSDLVFAVITILLPGSHRHLCRLCHLCRPTHPPHTTTIPQRGGGGEGDFRHGDVPGGGKRIGSGANAPTMLDLRRKPSTGVPVSWKGMEAGKEWRGIGADTPCASRTLASSPKKLRKKWKLFFFFPFGLIDCLVCLSRVLRWKSWTLTFWIGSSDSTPLFDCALCPRGSSGTKGGILSRI